MYFQTFSKLEIPKGLDKPEHDLKYYIIAMARDKVGAKRMADLILKQQKADEK